MEDNYATEKNGHQLDDVCNMHDKDIERKKRVFVDVSGQLFELSPLPLDYVVAPTDEVILLGSEKFPDWNSILVYLEVPKKCAMNHEHSHVEWMVDMNLREKADGRMTASLGENLANRFPQIHFYPEDQAKLLELAKKGDDEGVYKLKKELIKSGKYYE